MSDDPLDVTGEWTGIYNYPLEHPPNRFTATLRETAGIVTGETVEPSPSRHAGYGGGQAHAFLDCRRDSALVSFLKQYDATHRADTPVAYAGALSSDGDEITGRWQVSGDWSGTFIMVRRTRGGASVERRTAEVVR